MNYILIFLSVLTLSGCLAPSGGGSSPAARLAPETPVVPDPSAPQTVSEITSALHGKFILQSDSTHSIEFQGNQIYYDGTAISTKHVQSYNTAAGMAYRNHECTWQADFVEVRDYTTYKAVIIDVSSTNSTLNHPGIIRNCANLNSTNFTIEFTTADCFKAGLPSRTEDLTYCRE